MDHIVDDVTPCFSNVYMYIIMGLGVADPPFEGTNSVVDQMIHGP